MVNQKLELEDICFDLYIKLYKGQQISKEAILKVFDDLPTSFTEDINEEVIKRFTTLELFKSIKGMVDGKAIGHDGILVNFFKKCWKFIGEKCTERIIQALSKGISPWYD